MRAEPGPACRQPGRRAGWLILALLGLSLSQLTAAQDMRTVPASGRFEIARQTITAGGGVAESGRFRVTGTIGQAEAAPPMSSRRFQLSGGFHRRSASERDDRIFFSRFEVE